MSGRSEASASDRHERPSTWHAALAHIVETLGGVDDIAAVGHRVVHGGERLVKPVVIDDEVVRTIEECSGACAVAQSAGARRNRVGARGHAGGAARRSVRYLVPRRAAGCRGCHRWRAIGRHVDGHDTARGTGDGDALGRHRCRDPALARAFGHDHRRDRRAAQPPLGTGRRQRHRERRLPRRGGGGRERRRAGTSGHRHVRAPSSQVHRRVRRALSSSRGASTTTLGSA